jgi:hypothetical protein
MNQVPNPQGTKNLHIGCGFWGLIFGATIKASSISFVVNFIGRLHGRWRRDNAFYAGMFKVGCGQGVDLESRAHVETLERPAPDRLCIAIARSYRFDVAIGGTLACACFDL